MCPYRELPVINCHQSAEYFIANFSAGKFLADPEIPEAPQRLSMVPHGSMPLTELGVVVANT
ncbi:MAG: hypothetical protein RL345_403 [Chloroflexota bacterium]|jgi:hypothetical protein